MVNSSQAISLVTFIPFCIIIKRINLPVSALVSTCGMTFEIIALKKALPFMEAVAFHSISILETVLLKTEKVS